MSGHRGVTLIELVVALALLGIMSGVVGLSIRTARRVPTPNVALLAAARARDSALRLGRPVTIVIARDSQSFDVTALPDGRVIAAKKLAIDPLTGASDATP